LAWVKIDDHFAEHPKIATAGPLAGWLHVCALCYCNRHLTDGFIPARIVGTLADFTGINDEANGEAKPKQLASTLLHVGLWEEADGGYRIHDYLEYNPSRDEVLATREKRADAGRIGGKRSGTARNEAKAKQNASNVPSKPSNKTEAKSNPVPVPVPQDESNDSSDAPDGADDGAANKDDDAANKGRRATRFPDDAVLTDEWRVTAIKLGYPPEHVDWLFDEFKDYWCSAAGRNATKLDWLAVWRNRVRDQVANGRKIKHLHTKPAEEVPGYESWRERKLVL
jgi:general stress protein YciG